MKNVIKLIRIAILVMAIAFTMTSCKDPDGGGNGGEPENTTFQIKSTADWKTAVSQINGKTGEYTLIINGNIGIEGTRLPTFDTTSGLTVTLKGSGKMFLTSDGYILGVGSEQTFVIDSENLTLEGMSTNMLPLIRVGGTLELKNGTISGNTSSGWGGGVYVDSGTFTMSGGTISGNTDNSGTKGGGGVLVNDGTFIMNGGTISSNTADRHGGGVYVFYGTFTMNGGTILDNFSSYYGGGVGVDGGTFTMNGGTISDNKGCGVYVNNGTFNMNSGIISGNTGSYGGGVCVKGAFTMNGGTISGNTASDGGGVYIDDGIFTMIDGTISSNAASDNGGGVWAKNVNSNTNVTEFYIVTGTIYGSNEPIAAFRNTATSGEALYLNDVKGTAQYGTFSGTTWNSNGSLSSTDNTIKVVNGVLQ